MPTEYTPTPSWHDTITCVAAGDYMRPSGIVAGLEDLADNAESLRQRFQDYIEAFAVVRSYTDLLTLNPSVTNTCTVQIPGTEFYALYRFVPGAAATLTEPWQLPGLPSIVGHWQMIGPPVDSYATGVACYGPMRTGDTTPASKIPVFRLQGAMLYAGHVTLDDGATSISATNGALTVPSLVLENPVIEAGAVVEVCLGPMWVLKSESVTNGAQLEVLLRTYQPGVGSTDTSLTFVNLDDATLANGGGYLTLPASGVTPVTGYQSIVLQLTGPSTGTVTLRARNQESGLGTWRITQSSVI